MRDWIIKHQTEGTINDSDKCTGCLHVSEAQWALSQAQEERKEKETKTKEKVQTKLVYDFKLKEWTKKEKK